MRRFGAGLAAFSLLTGCGAWLQQQPAPPETPAVISSQRVRMAPLPGALDAEPLLHSNSPERIESPGLILSTLPGGGRLLDHALTGDFSLFLHHIARMPVLDPRTLWIGLLAHADSAGSVSLRSGNVALTWPDAPFLALPTLQANPEGRIFAGPGDRVALATLRGDSLPAQRWELASGEDQLLLQWPIPTNPLWVVQQDNALSALLRLHASAPMRFSLIALHHPGTPRLSDYRAVRMQGLEAGPAEPPVTEYTPGQPPSSGAFRYGRVAGVARGARWQGELRLDAAQWQALLQGESLGWPVSALALKDSGTGHIQSAPLLVRVPGTAVESHGNYGVHYRLRVPLHNPGSQPLRLRWHLQQPLDLKAGVARFSSPPQNSVRFRGTLRSGSLAQPQDQHLVLKAGEADPPFWEVTLAPDESVEALLEWIYPPDATPPQLLRLDAVL
ncbi:MAG: DUF3370 family protein [Candidatus Sericytochromatia bacterium]